MEYFLILVLGALVFWLVSKRSADQQYARQLYELASRLEDRVLRLERAQELKAVSLRAEPQARTPDAVQPTAAKPEPAHVRPDIPVPIPQAVPRSQLQTEVPRAGAPAMPGAAEGVTAGVGPTLRTVSTQPPTSIGPFVSRFGSTPEEPSQTPYSVKPSPSLEERLGANWLNKLGIIILVIGVTFFLAYQLRTLGPLGKTVVGFVVSSTLLIGGLLLERRNRYQVFARAGIGGGWALTFFVTYAMYHVAATHILSSQAVDLILMMLVAVGMIWHSLLYKSQVVTSLAFLLAFCTVGISHVTVFSLVAGLLLAVGLVFVTSREHWYELELAGLRFSHLEDVGVLLQPLPAKGALDVNPEELRCGEIVKYLQTMLRSVGHDVVQNGLQTQLGSGYTDAILKLFVEALDFYRIGHADMGAEGLLQVSEAPIRVSFDNRNLRSRLA